MEKIPGTQSKRLDIPWRHASPTPQRDGRRRADRRPRRGRGHHEPDARPYVLAYDTADFPPGAELAADLDELLRLYDNALVVRDALKLRHPTRDLHYKQSRDPL
jgi:hypothetical protein